MLNVIHSIPQSAVLREWIQHYYFLKQDQADLNERFTHYPHFRSTVNVYQHADITLTESSRIVKHNLHADLQTIFTNNISQAKQAHLIGPIDVVGISFKPLGINHFVRKDFFRLPRQPVVRMNDDWSKDHVSFKTVFEADSNESKTELLDQIYTALYQPIKIEKLTSIVTAILDQNGNIEVSELSEKFKINRRTLLRLFRRHLGCSISQFKQVVKFRHTLDSYLTNDDKPSFTELSYIHDYYDQSDFISHFKALTGEIPKQVLNQLSAVGNRGLFWKIQREK